MILEQRLSRAVDTFAYPYGYYSAATKALVREALGLERYYHYTGQDVGAGMQQLVNIANGNSILRWTPFDNHKLTSYLATLRYLVHLAKTGETPVTEFLRPRVLSALKIVDLHVANQPFIVGKRATMRNVCTGLRTRCMPTRANCFSGFPASASLSERTSEITVSPST